MTPWGILDFCNCKIIFRGGNPEIVNYFLSFFSAIQSIKNIYKRGLSPVVQGGQYEKL